MPLNTPRGLIVYPLYTRRAFCVSSRAAVFGKSHCRSTLQAAPVSNWHFTGRPSRSSCVMVDLPWYSRPIAFTFSGECSLFSSSVSASTSKSSPTTQVVGPPSSSMSTALINDCLVPRLRRKRDSVPRIYCISGRMLDSAYTPAGGSSYSTMCCIKTETKFEQTYFCFRKLSEREILPA